MKDGDDPSSVCLRSLPPNRYKEFSRLGEGSMGVVYLALDTELNRRVALKMIRTGAGEVDAGPLEATPTPGDEFYGELKARFLQEAWVTGGLEHPGIVPVYELGRTTGGVPYYTMRLVRGERTLTDAIEAATRLDERLALLEPFLKVCDTIRYAHARGVIHRDLKPSNIALGNFGETVVLDWGLAKLKDRPDVARSVWQSRIKELRSETDLETLASAIGTPGYMSPEAALVNVEEVDARSDVYSLGAILYRILTGKLPHEFTNYPELIAKLTTERPVPPSKVDPAIPGGLSEICLKTLSEKREDRYSDAHELAAAIRAWQRESAVDREVATLLREAESALKSAPELGGEALLRSVDRVTAVCARILELRPGHKQAQRLQQEGHRQRERAIAERERGARKRLLRRVAVVGLLTATAATVVVALLLEARRREAEEARQREQVARTRAEQERARAEDLANFMLFDLQERLKPIGRLDLLGSVALKTREYYESLPPLEDSGDKAVRKRAAALQNVAAVLEAQGDLTAALEVARESLAIRTRLAEQDPTNANLQYDLATGLSSVGVVLEKQGNLDGALDNYREALAIQRRLAERAPTNVTLQRDLSLSLQYVGHTLSAQADLEGALAFYRESLAIRRCLAEQDPRNAKWQRDLSAGVSAVGGVLLRQGNLESALRNHREVLAIQRRLAEKNPTNATVQSDLSAALFTVGDGLVVRGELEEALDSFRESLAIRRRLGDQDPTNAMWQRYLADSVYKVGDVLEAQGDLEEALNHYREALAIRRRLAEQDPTNAFWQSNVARSLSKLGEVLKARGNGEGALEAFREAVAILKRLADQDPTSAVWLRGLSAGVYQLGEVLKAQGNRPEALKIFRESLEIARRLAEQDPTELVCQRLVAAALAKIGAVLEEQGNRAGALESYRESLAIARRLVEQDPTRVYWQSDVSFYLNEIGDVLRAQGNLVGALDNYREALTIRRRLAEREPTDARWQRDLSLSLHRVGDEVMMKGDFEVALKHQREALAIRKRLVEQEPTNAKRRHNLARSQIKVGENLYRQRKYVRAAEWIAAVLQDEASRADPDANILYNGACAAALASTTTRGKEADSWRQQALEWLGEDIRRRRAVLQRIDKELSGVVAPQRAAQLRRQRAPLLKVIEDARARDPDLAALRGSPEFGALFAEEKGAK